MALVFPSSASINQTYQSGSSATYKWDGAKWIVDIPPTQIFTNATLAQTSSLADTASYVGQKYIFATRTSLQALTSSSTNISFTTVLGTLSQTNGVFTLPSGSVYELEGAVVSSTVTNTSFVWYNITTGDWIGGPQVMYSPTSTAIYSAGSGVAKGIIAPTSTITVALRQYSGFTLNIQATDFSTPGGIVAWASIREIR